MSRVSLIEQLYAKRKSALEFNYDDLWAPPIRSIFTQEDINELYRIATSLRYNGNIEKKYELIDNVMRSRGFRRAHCGTNRVVYNFLEIPTFVAKVALDKVGLKDSPAEFKNQEYFKPFCCKIFEVDPSGVIAFVERVNPITSLEEFISVSDDIFNMMVTKIIGKYVVDDLGTEKFMNYGLRQSANGYTFGPVIIDFPYAYELDGGKLICQRPIETPMGEIPCGGEIDYDAGFNHLVCTKCGKRYEALDLKKNDKNIIIMYGNEKEGDLISMRAQIIADGKVIADSGLSSKNHITKEQYESIPSMYSNSNHEDRPVGKNIRKKYKRLKDYRNDYHTSLQVEQYNRMQETIMNDNSRKVKVTNNEKSSVTVDNKTENTYNSNYCTIKKVINNLVVSDTENCDKEYLVVKVAAAINDTDEVASYNTSNEDNHIEEPEYVAVEEDLENSDEYDENNASDQDELIADTAECDNIESEDLKQQEQENIGIEEPLEDDNTDIYESIINNIKNNDAPESCVIGMEEPMERIVQQPRRKNRFDDEYDDDYEYKRNKSKNKKNKKYNEGKKHRKSRSNGFYDYDDGMDDF